MKKVIPILLGVSLLVGAVCCLPIPAKAANTTYYVDSVNGSDRNNGLSASRPWKTISKVNGKTFSSGDKILFKAGSTYTGTLHPLGSGSANAPIVIDMYGQGSKPVFNGGGANSAVYLSGQSYWEINNLEVTNNAYSEGTRRGILVEASRTVNHVYVQNCYIHNVRGNNDFSYGKNTGGIIFLGNGSGNAKFNDVLIADNTINYCDRTGIHFGEGCGNGYNFVNTGLVVRNNSINYPGGDGSIIHFTDGGLIEYNTVNTSDNVSTQVSAGIWPWYCKDTVFQYNEGYNCKYSADFDDGMPWDIDGGNQNCVYQYNYSHDNDGGSVMICADASCPSNGSIIRYNISQNDGGRVLNLTGPSTNTYYYNNTAYLDSNMSTDIVGAVDLGGNHRNLYAYNNIFYNLGSGGYDMGGSTGNHFDYNVYYGNHPSSEPSDPHKITANPRFVNPGAAGIGRDTAVGYKLQANSPCIDSGKVIANNGGQDFWGNPVPTGSGVDRGACEYVAEGGQPSDENLALYKSVSSSSIEGSGLEASKAVDGDTATRWASSEGTNPTEWIQIDLGSVQSVSRVDLNWEAAYATKYKIQYSTNGWDFADALVVNNGTGGQESKTFTPVDARYIRIYGTEKFNSSWGYSLYEIGVYH
ncbi:MAG: discoidin domain-containing protein [Pseudobutyrivibrio sp.]|nr:discoidin domain-containing protein [Pseudobutyrivibrio sp.]